MQYLFLKDQWRLLCFLVATVVATVWRLCGDCVATVNFQGMSAPVLPALWNSTHTSPAFTELPFWPSMCQKHDRY